MIMNNNCNICSINDYPQIACATSQQYEINYGLLMHFNPEESIQNNNKSLPFLSWVILLTVLGQVII